MPADPTPDAPADEPEGGVPTQVRTAAALQAVEGGAVVVAGLAWGVYTVAGQPTDLASSLFGALFTIAFGALLVRLAIGIGRAQQWARSPVVAIQCLMLPVSIALAFQASTPLYGLPVLAVALALLYLLFTKPAHRVFDRELRRD